jgi:hypothetical protein
MNLPNIQLYSFKPPNKVESISHNLYSTYISLYTNAMGKGRQRKITSTRAPLVVDNDPSSSQGERKKVRISCYFKNVDPEHDRSLRSQRQIWWPSESESVMRMLPRSCSYQAFVPLSVKTRSRLFLTAQRSFGFFGFPNLKKKFMCIDLFLMMPAMTTTSAANDLKSVLLADY